MGPLLIHDFMRMYACFFVAALTVIVLGKTLSRGISVSKHKRHKHASILTRNRHRACSQGPSHCCLNYDFAICHCPGEITTQFENELGNYSRREVFGVVSLVIFCR